jgi:NAD(P)-dependent dehydrogenase (short-subunit alcohol dehydrogenase family)
MMKRGRAVATTLSGAAAPGAAVTPVAADVTSVADTDRLVSRVLEAYPQVDVLVNNAYASGDTFGRHVLDVEDEAREITFRANVLGPFRLCRGFGKGMVSGQGVASDAASYTSGTALFVNGGRLW